MFHAAWTAEAYEHDCQDMVAVFSEPERCVIAVADGVGGMSSGGQAAAAIVEQVRSTYASTESTEAWSSLLCQGDGRIGLGEFSAVVVDVQRAGICGASVEDSQAWVVKGADIANLTAGQRRKPVLGSGGRFRWFLA